MTKMKKGVTNKSVCLISLVVTQFLLMSCSNQKSTLNQVADNKNQNTLSCINNKNTDNQRVLTESSLRKRVKLESEALTLFSISERMEYYKVPAVSVAVMKQGKVEWSKAYGVKSFTSQESVDCNTLFQAGSLSKPVTMLAAMRMHEAGEIDLDKDINQYLKVYELPEGKQTVDNPVTFRNILKHTSGITSGGYRGYANDEGFPSDIEVLTKSGVTNSKLVEVLQVPGKELAYSGGGYTVAELAMQDVTQQSFKELMDIWILNPLKMSNADFAQPLPPTKHERVARGHSLDGKMVKGGWHDYPEQAAAGLWATATDMALFMIEIHKGYHGKSAIFKKSMIMKMLSQPRDKHVYGFHIRGEGENLLISHYGGTAGYTAGMHIYLESGDGLSYLTSSGNNGGALSQELEFAVSDIYGWPDFKQHNVTRRSVSSKALKNLAGQYSFGGWAINIEFSESDNNITVVFPNNDRYQLIPTTDSEHGFVHMLTGTKVSFPVKKDLNTILIYGQTGTKL